MKPSQNRPSWRLPKIITGNPNARFPGYVSKFGDGHPSRRQCIAKARSTGKQCKQDAMQGASTCHMHGGHVHAYRAAGVTWSKATMRSAPRKELARIGSGSPPADLPVWVKLPVSPVERGRLYEAWRNAQMDPATWLRVTGTHKPPSKYGPHDPAAACRAPPPKPRSKPGT
jgi:hypothetical protein